MKILIADTHDVGLYKCRGELIDRLIQKKYDVYISVPEGEYTEALINKGCEVIKCDVDRHGTNPFSELALVLHYRKILKKLHPDCVLTYSIKPNVYLGWLCGLYGIPYITNITGLGSALVNGGLLSKISFFLYRLGLRKAKKVFFQNSDNCRAMLSKGGVRGNYEILPGSGVNLEQHSFEEYPADGEKIVFLTIGRIMKDKGIDELLQAARNIKKNYPSVIFRLIGFYDGEYEEVIRKATEDGIVEFLGYKDNVHEYIKDSWAIVHPSYHEGMANALLEGAASGRPVIASDVPGCKETFDDGVSGISVTPRDADDLEKGIQRFIELPYQTKVKMGLNGRQKMERLFNREIIINKYMDEISSLPSLK